MIFELKLYLFILSLLFLFRIIVSFLIEFFSENPKVLSLNVYEKILFYFSFSYIITFIIILIRV
jgi:hypothetical protein